MAKYVIHGGKKLEGEIKASGSKNASLPIIAATILSGKTTTLYNVPKIQDIKITLDILKLLGCKVKQNNDKIVINSSNIHTQKIPEELMSKLRSSVILAGALIGRFKHATFSYPGGCDIGARPIDLHLSAFEKLGVQIEKEAGYIICKCDKIVGNEIHFDFPSVGATENAIMASVLGEGETIISNAAMEPEIIDLQNFLNRMGAKVSGAGTNVIRVQGVKDLKSASYNIMPDRIEIGTFLCATAITGGNIKITHIVPEHILPIIVKLEETGCKITTTKDTVSLEAPKKIKAIELKTMPYPGFPTDMQAIFTSMLTIAKGTSVVVENIFENRFKYTNELNKMGAKIVVEGKIAVVKGVRRLSGANVNSTDLRGGAGMVIAALVAKGKTEVNDISYILRGYEDFEHKLSTLGAKIIVEK